MDTDELKYAGFWIRVGAALIDTVLLLIVTTPLLVWIYGWGYYGDGKLISGPSDFVISWIAPAVATVLLWLGWQATPGKMMLSLRVVDADSGKTVSAGQAAVRYITYFLSALPFFLGFIWVAIDQRKQGWHDKIAQTAVVRAGDRGPVQVRFDRDPTVPAGRESGYGRTQKPLKRWLAFAAIALALSLVGLAITLPEVRWIPYGTKGLLTEYRLMQVPVHQPYPPDTVCWDGFLERVNVRARTSHHVRDDHGNRVPCLP